MSENIETAWHKAMEDAILLGMGVMVIHPDMSMRRVSPEEYHLLAEELHQAQEDYLTAKPLLKE